jgi:acetyl esterase
MGASPSSFLRQVDEHPGETLDEDTAKSFLGPDPSSNGWCHQNAALWESLRKDDAGGVKKELIMRAFGWPDEVADGSMGTREEARAINDAAEAAAVGTPHFYEMNPEEARANRRKAYVHSETRETFSIPGRGEHDVWHPIRFAKWTPSKEKWPDGPRGIYLLFHGGGWVFGDACGQNDVRLEQMCEELGLVVLVPDYSKAPEHPYPAAVNECELAAVWVEENAEKEFGAKAAKMMILGGESAGGNLCAAVLLRARDRWRGPRPEWYKKGWVTHRGLEGWPITEVGEAIGGGFEHKMPWKLANLVYGIYDVAGTPSVSAFGERRLVETARDVQWFGDCYCPDREMRKLPDVSPLRGDFRGMPPAFFTVGMEDALADDTFLMHKKWVEWGNGVSLDVWPEGPHGVGHFGVHATSKLGLACRKKLHYKIDMFIKGEPEIPNRYTDTSRGGVVRYFSAY